MWFAGLIIGGLIEGLAWRLMRQLSAGDTVQAILGSSRK